MNNNNKEILKMTIKPILFLLTLTFFSVFVSVKGFFVSVFLVLYTSMFFDFFPTLVENSKKYVKIIIIVTLFMLLLRFLGGYGILGLVLSIIVMALWRIWKAKDLFMASIRNIETMIFGKPLDKVEVVEEKQEVIKQ